MRGDVPANSIAENIFAKKTFQHPQKRLTLLVGNVIKSAVSFRLRRDQLLNRMRGRSRVTFHRRLLGNSNTPRRVPW